MALFIIGGRYSMNIKSDVMGMKINRFQNLSQRNIQEAMTRLSTGLRINSAKDDASGLSISTRLTAQSRGIEQAKRNIKDSISLVRTADGTLSTVGDMLQRLSELTIQAQNGTYSTSDKTSIQKEADELMTAINNLTSKATFNGKTIFDSGSSLKFDGTGKVTIPFDPIYNISDKVTLSAWFNPESNNGTILVKGGEPETYSMGIRNGKAFFYRETQTGTNKYLNGSISISLNEWHNLTVVDDGNEMSIYVDGVKDANVLSSAGWDAGTDSSVVLIGGSGQSGGESVNAGAFKGSIKDVQIINDAKDQNEINQIMFQDTPSNDPNLVGNWKLNEGSGTSVSDSSSNEVPGVVTNGVWNQVENIGDVHSGYEFDNQFKMDFKPINTGTLGINGLNLSEPTSVEKIKNAIDKISFERAKYGAYENRLQVKVDNLSTQGINTENANSRIKDADILSETSNLTKEQVKLQLSMQMLKKNDMNRQSVVSLLQG